MNKYKKALAKVRNDCFWSSHDKGYEYITNKTFEKLDLLQDVVGKETPMKPIEVDEKQYVCKKCRVVKTHTDSKGFANNYCNTCGQKIDWGDQSE